MELKSVSDPLYESKCSYWRRDFSIPVRRIRVCASDNENTKILLAMLRIIEADKFDFETLVASAGSSSSYRSIRDAQVAISVHNEQNAMHLLIQICNNYLKKYPTSYEDDCNRLRYGNLTPFSNERHALIQVKGEKEVLLFFKDFAYTASSLLNITDRLQIP